MWISKRVIILWKLWWQRQAATLNLLFEKCFIAWCHLGWHHGRRQTAIFQCWTLWRVRMRTNACSLRSLSRRRLCGCCQCQRLGASLQRAQCTVNATLNFSSFSTFWEHALHTLLEGRHSTLLHLTPWKARWLEHPPMAKHSDADGCANRSRNCCKKAH